jgi:hypothetical protein
MLSTSLLRSWEGKRRKKKMSKTPSFRNAVYLRTQVLGKAENGGVECRGEVGRAFGGKKGGGEREGGASHAFWV